MLTEIDSHLNPLACVPADCNSLTVDEHFAPFVGDYTEQPAHLQHLAITYREHPTDSQTSGRDPLDILDDLSHLTQLRSLKVEIHSTFTFCFSHGLASLNNFPGLLTNLYIGGWERGRIRIDLPNPDLGRRQESERLRRLKNLEFHMCSLHIGAGSVANLSGLTSLSISDSAINSNIDAVLQLTNLVSLDLTGVVMQGDTGRKRPWSRFEAWPALHVLKVSGGCLIDNSTALHIANVQEVHTDRLTLGTTAANVHLVLRQRHAVIFEALASLSVPWWSTHLVDLHVVVTDWRDTALYLATIVNQVLKALLCLQSFHLAGGYQSPGNAVDYSEGQIVLGDDYSGQLKDLKLQDLYYHTVNLGVATCLTSIRLYNIDQPCVPCELTLPSSVVQLEVFCDSLTMRHAKCLLQGLPSLTHVTLGRSRVKCVNEPELSSSACMATMPGSLRWLRVMCNPLKKLLDGSAQDCLRFCTGLEYLILPLDQHAKGELYAWVKDARYVRVSDHDPEENPWWHDAY